MTLKTIDLITCERCGMVGQVNRQTAMPVEQAMGWAALDVDFVGPEDVPIESWHRFIPIGEAMFQVIGLDYRDTGGTINLDLCPTCKMAFATWWLAGRA